MVQVFVCEESGENIQIQFLRDIPIILKIRLQEKQELHKTNLTVGLWGLFQILQQGFGLGADDRATHFEDIVQGQGATMSLPTWALFMKKCYADSILQISQEDFERPEKVSIQLDCKSVQSFYEDGERIFIQTEEEETDF